MIEIYCEDEAALRRLAGEFIRERMAGEVVLLQGNLGAGKTTWVRGAMLGLGYEQNLRSPTYNLVQTFDSAPPVLHADLYRITNLESLGLEDFEATHLWLIEWPENCPAVWNPAFCYLIQLEFREPGRLVRVLEPGEWDIIQLCPSVSDSSA